MQARVTFTAGRLICGQVRDFLKRAQFSGAKIEWLESSGFLERDFTIKGEAEHVKQIEKILESCAK